jgi:hypothetical protein
MTEREMTEREMTEREYLLKVFECVRAYFRNEADLHQRIKMEVEMREAMYAYMDARERGDFDEEDNK